MIPTVFRRHPDGTVTDVYEDACVWVRDGEAAHVQALQGKVVDFADMPAPTSFSGLRAWFWDDENDGLLFTHADGRQAQITRQDFGL